MFGERNGMHGLWAQDFASSPIMTSFGWSALVELAFDNNRETISPTTTLEPPLSAQPFTTNRERYSELPGLLVLHIRRGDYEDHCKHLARWSSTFLAFNGLPQLEQFTPPPGGPAEGTATEEGMALYLQRCYPSMARIVDAAEEARRAEAARGRPRLERVFVMTNGAAEWVGELKAALAATGHWMHVASSRDLVLNWEQKYVAQAVDMLIRQRAQVFIGNGVRPFASVSMYAWLTLFSFSQWSSLTGGIVIMRMANGFRPETTLFF